MPIHLLFIKNEIRIKSPGMRRRYPMADKSMIIPCVNVFRICKNVNPSVKDRLLRMK
jgi:hypothetical protein